MVSGQHTSKVKESGSKVDISEDLTKSRLVAVTEKPELETSSTSGITATTLNGTQKTLKSARLQELRSKAGLVAGALADFQAKGGTVVRQEMTYKLPSGSYKAIKFVIAVKEADLVAIKTEDGVDFDIVADMPKKG